MVFDIDSHPGLALLLIHYFYNPKNPFPHLVLGFIVKFMEQVLTYMASQAQNGMNTNSGNLVGDEPGDNNNSHVRRNLNFTENQTTSAYSNTSTPIN